MNTQFIPLHLIEKAAQHHRELFVVSNTLFVDIRHKSPGMFGDYIVEFELVYDKEGHLLGQAFRRHEQKPKKEKQK